MKLASVFFFTLCLLPLATACGDDDASNADATVVADADPNAPDAPPVVYDANPTQPDAPPPAYDANPGVADQVVCGESTCDTPQVCCVTYAGGVSYACTASDGCTGGATLACDGPEDCSTTGDVCCAGSGMNVSTTCSPGGTCDRKLCRGDGECNVGAGETCCPLGGTGISVCSTVCY